MTTPPATHTEARTQLANKLALAEERLRTAESALGWAKFDVAEAKGDIQHLKRQQMLLGGAS